MSTNVSKFSVADWSPQEHSQFVALLQLYTDPTLHLADITAKLNSPNKTQRDVEIHLKAYFARFMDTATQSGVLPPTVHSALQSSMPVIRASSMWNAMSNEFTRSVLQTSGGFASLLADV
jgi:hypothetical protein